MLTNLLRSNAHRLLKRLQPYRDIVLIPYLNNRELLTPEDIILLSYPRSGNTWARYLIADLVQQSLGYETNTHLPIDFWKVVPSIYTQSLAELATDSIWTTCRLVKSHEHQDLANRKAIYIFRRPEDVLCSYDHFNCNKNSINKLDVSIDKFCRDKLSEWINHIEGAIQYYEANPEQMLWICYEYLHLNPYISLASVMKFIKLSESNVDIDKAIQNHSFESRKKVATQEDLLFATRKGKIDSSKEELRPETLQLIQQKTRVLYDRVCSFSEFNSSLPTAINMQIESNKS